MRPPAPLAHAALTSTAATLTPPPPRRPDGRQPAQPVKHVRCPACGHGHLTRGADGTWRLRVKVVAFPSSGGCNTSCVGCGTDFEARLPQEYLRRLSGGVDAPSAR